ncbi:hypothetical protein [Tsukamurella strandjordii]|uniref:Uncharacterized protein n=1 Tax=Tsukamurella strandjordii TaxID=147577 RepID=A0AA90NAI7_9ACTN|nr:hypothetical protein [Tsukamurella strandjordii]MDP0396942.1 hypothetical protein [Tsukamurella strandjordii]
MSERIVFRRSDGGRTTVRHHPTDDGAGFRLAIVDGEVPDEVTVDPTALYFIDDYDPRSLVSDAGLVVSCGEPPHFGTWERLDAWPV